MKVLLHKQKQLTSFQIIIFGFAGVILTGAILLTLPFAAASEQRTSFADALFTATSSVCVTGLVVQDTATYWSVFGQLIIIVLIQIGGMGVITVAAFFAMLSGRKITLMQRSTMQEAIAAPKVGGIVRLTGFIIKTALLIEVLGAVVMAPVFCQDFGVKKGLWMALFHSISAFCNAGFDLMGVTSPFSSLTSYVSHPTINLVIMLLIVTGGIGFLTWDDIRTNRLHLSKYRMQSKVILCTTAALILIPALYFFVSEFSCLPLGERIWSSFFQSVTPRTAGFNTVDLTEISEAGQMVMIVLMLIGGSPGSTAGGMKTTTIAVLIAVASSVFSRKEYPHFFGRSIADETVRNAAAIVLMYIVLFLGGGMSISIAEGLPLVPCLFETASAIGTVGLSLGLTPELGSLSRIILIGLMFFGRVGGLTLIYAALSGMYKNTAKFPHEKITVG